MNLPLRFRFSIACVICFICLYMWYVGFPRKQQFTRRISASSMVSNVLNMKRNLTSIPTVLRGLSKDFEVVDKTARQTAYLTGKLPQINSFKAGLTATDERLPLAHDSTTPANKGFHLQNNKSEQISQIDCEQEVPDLTALWDRLVIVTAISENHVNEAYGMIGSAQKHMPGKRIIVYDLGLKGSLQQIKKLCDVEVRPFDFSKYPPHVANLHTYAWKVLIIRETLFEFGAIFYGDASARFLDSLQTLFPYLYLNHCYMVHIHSYDPKLPAPIDHQYFHTNPKQFAELGVNRTEYYQSHKAAPHISAGRVLMINDSLVNEQILKPLLKCALNKDCIAPPGSALGKHRFDASALAILTYKNMRYVWTPDNRNTSTEVSDKVVDIQRITRDRKTAKYC